MPDDHPYDRGYRAYQEGMPLNFAPIGISIDEYYAYQRGWKAAWWDAATREPWLTDGDAL